MAFGFPASAEAEVRYNATEAELLNAVEQALEELGWRYERAGPVSFTAKLSVNWSSWGERLTVRVRRDGVVEVHSACRLITQCLDWGRNQENVDTFLDRLGRVLARDDPRRPHGAAGEGESHGQAIRPARDQRVRKLPDDAAAPPPPPPGRPRPGAGDDAYRA